MINTSGFTKPDINPFTNEPMDTSACINSIETDSRETKKNICTELLYFKTTQTNVPIPTKELMKSKKCDFRIYAVICMLSNVDNCKREGSNVRYTSLYKFDKNLNSISEVLGLTKSKIRSELNRLLEQNSYECSLIVREYENQNVDCVQMAYGDGGFVLVPVDVLQNSLLKISNIALKMFLNLLWLCYSKADFGYKETLVYQDTLLKCMGYKPTSRKLITDAGKELEAAGLISVRRGYDCKTVVVDGKIVATTPKKQCFYNILI